jgi:hypothetical protein
LDEYDALMVRSRLTKKLKDNYEITSLILMSLRKIGIVNWTDLEFMRSELFYKYDSAKRDVSKLKVSDVILIKRKFLKIMNKLKIINDISLLTMLGRL